MTQLLGYGTGAEFRIRIFENVNRGKGIGKIVAQKTIEIAFTQYSYSRIFLTVHKLNTTAIILYESLGFVAVPSDLDDFLKYELRKS
jgi:RimJ/RimL family protein N-acetyltransferase